jgi:hypothetical protein
VNCAAFKGENISEFNALSYIDLAQSGNPAGKSCDTFETTQNLNADNLWRIRNIGAPTNIERMDRI